MNLKLASVAFLTAGALALTGCAASGSSSASTATATSTANPAPSVAPGFVAVVVPAVLSNYSQIDTKQLTAAGVSDIQSGSDGSLVLTMPAAVAPAVAATIKTEILAEEARLQADPAQSIKSFTNADDFSTIGVNTTITQDFGGTGSAFKSLGVMAVEYQLFSGNTAPDVKISINKADGTSEQVLDFPNVLAY